MPFNDQLGAHIRAAATRCAQHGHGLWRAERHAGAQACDCHASKRVEGDTLSRGSDIHYLRRTARLCADRAYAAQSGDRVWMENPGASGARNAFLSQGAELVPVDVDNEGMVVSDGLSKSPHFRLAFVTPTHQQPLGHVMSLARRFELLRATEEAQGLVIEDDYDGEFYFENAPQPALYSTDTSGRVLYVGTFSKSLFPALRLGFILVPERMIDAFDQTFSAWASGPATATQAIVADFMDEGILPPISA
nr:PLP-dependent aminotransferase family protein [Marinicella sp. W31]MDC2875593.1 PLP-dependent aminotransferase family protein [Marinicella sp. W31]